MEFFKVLEFNQSFMSEIVIYSDRLPEITNEFSQSFYSYIILCYAIIFEVGGALFAANSSSGFGIVLETSVTIIGGDPCARMLLIIGLKTKRVKVHFEIQKIVDQANSSKY